MWGSKMTVPGMTQGMTMVLVLTPRAGLVETYPNVDSAQLVNLSGQWYLRVRYSSGQMGFTRSLKELENISSPGPTSFDVINP